ncbi:MAG: rod shape-determining protein MreC [bacterium]|nr:rod shape-determining protein MreC [bacterium]
MRKYRPLIILIIIIIIGITISPFGFLNPVRNYANILVSPVTSAFNRTTIGASDFFHTLFFIGRIVKENTELKTRYNQLQSDNISLKEVRHENKLLKGELKFVQSTNLQLISANIILKSPSGFIDSVVINKGSRKGIKINQAVISQGFLIGKINKVYKNTSEVILITSSSSKLPAYLQESRGTGVIQGGLKGLSLEDIQLDITPRPGEAVLSSDIGGILPRGIPIGSVKEVSLSHSDISRSAAISSPIFFTHLEMVFVVK